MQQLVSINDQTNNARNASFHERRAVVCGLADKDTRMQLRFWVLSPSATAEWSPDNQNVTGLQSSWTLVLGRRLRCGQVGTKLGCFLDHFLVQEMGCSTQAVLAAADLQLAF